MSREKEIEEAALDAGKKEHWGYSDAENHAVLYSNGYIDGAKWADENPKIPSEEFIVGIITEWKHAWMDVNGTDDKDRANYSRRASGVDANMKYDLARRIIKAKSE